jgi:hypothetical protein
MTNEIQRKHRREREAVVDDALYQSLVYLERSNNHFRAAIGDENLRNKFLAGTSHAREILQELGIKS